MSEVRGLPLLSGPPPSVDSGDSCRKCDREFNMFLNRSRKCNHCGYLYCHNCSDYQAMMPRRGQESGYDAMNVCAYCIEFLNITAAGRGNLRAMPLSKLKAYVDAYNIRTNRAIEKDDLIEAILKARGPNGCLLADNENYYRKYSVPNKSTRHSRSRLFSGSTNQNNIPRQPAPPPPSRTPQAHFPRPDLEQNAPSHHQYPPSGAPPTQQQHHPRPPPPPPRPPQPPNHQYRSHTGHTQNTQYTHRPGPTYTSYPQRQGYPSYQRPAASRSSEHLHDRPNVNQPSARPRASSAAPPTAPPIPTLEELLEMSIETISSLSIGTLKSILFRNHVNAGLILEKGELVTKVMALVEDEKRDRERQRAQEEAEDAERIRLQREMMEMHNQRQREMEERSRAEQQHRTEGDSRTDGETPTNAPFTGGEDVHMRDDRPTSPPLPPLPTQEPPTAPKTPPKVRGTAADLERTGLCVICQDEEANIAIVDCGHLAMCRSCSHLVMSSSKECPLCRTRIVTEARLLRIFKT